MTGRVLGPGRYGFADLDLGDRIETAAATVTVADIDRFADLTGDRFALHMSDEAARDLGFPARVAHGLLVLSLIDGLKNQAPAGLDAVASLGWEMRFRAPVLAGDSLRATFTVESMRPAREAARGIAVVAVEVLNQRGEVVQEGRTVLMMQG
ncbi:MAG: MaoC family dehydratase [Paracoccaceae bacterium]